jgi:hypothetical protein
LLRFVLLGRVGRMERRRGKKDGQGCTVFEKVGLVSSARTAFACEPSSSATAAAASLRIAWTCLCHEDYSVEVIWRVRSMLDDGIAGRVQNISG